MEKHDSTQRWVFWAFAGLALLSLLLRSVALLQPVELLLVLLAVVLAGALRLHQLLELEAQRRRELEGLLAESHSQGQQLRQERAELESQSETLQHAFSAANTRLKESLAKQYSIMDHIVDGILISDFQGEVLQTNRAWGSIVGKAEQTVEAVGCEELTALWEQAAARPGLLADKEIALPEGRIGHAIATAIHHTDESDGFFVQHWCGVLCLVRDVTQERELDKMKTDFISTVSHELRTPLTSILGFARIIEKQLDKNVLPFLPQEPSPKTQRALHRIHKNLDIIGKEGRRLTGLINDMLDVAKMEAGKMDWRVEPLQIADVLERSSFAISSLLEPKGLPLRMEIEPELPELRGDSDRLIQVLVNLFSNAIKFTEQGEIFCSAHAKGEFVEVAVKDSGIGIAPEDLEKVFERFQQVGDVFTDKPKGTGLGLPICKQIIEHHGGQIWVESALGQGCTFRFTLPTCQAGS